MTGLFIAIIVVLAVMLMISVFINYKLAIDKLTKTWVRRVYVLYYKLVRRKGWWVIFVDLDHLRTFNEYGHDVGDRVLRRVGSILTKLSHNRAARYGGDEFVVISQSPTQESAMALAEKIRDTVENEPIIYYGTRATVTCIVGRKEQDCKKAISDSKEKDGGSGRNKVHLAPPSTTH